jgi:hypothetical protein
MQSRSAEENEIVASNNTETLKRIGTYQVDISSKIEQLEKTYVGCNLKVNYLEDSLVNLNKEYEKLYNKVIEDVISVIDFTKKQEIINTNNAKKTKELKVITDDYTCFKQRVNDVITDLQSRIDNIEQHVSVKKTYIKKIDTLENKVNAQDVKLKALEKVSKKDVIPELTTEIEKHFKEYKASIDYRFSNTVKTAETRHNEMTSKFKNLIDEIDSFRNGSGSFDDDLKLVYKKFKVLDTKMSEIDLSKINKSIEIKVNKSDITHIADKINENGAIDKKKITDRIDNIEQRYGELSNKQCQDRVSSLEQQMICLMTDIHNLTHPSVQYNYSSPRLYSEPKQF